MDRFREKVSDLFNDTGTHSDKEIAATTQAHEKWVALVKRAYYECYSQPQANTMLTDYDRYWLGLKIMKAYGLLGRTAYKLFRLSRGKWAPKKIGYKIMSADVDIADTGSIVVQVNTINGIRREMKAYDRFAELAVEWNKRYLDCPVYQKVLKEHL